MSAENASGEALLGEGEYFEEEEQADAEESESNGTESLQQFLAEHNLQEHLSLLQQQQIDYETLMLLTEQDLKSLELPLGPYRKLVNALNKKKSGDAKVDESDELKKVEDSLVGEGQFTIVDESGDESETHSVKSDELKKKTDEPELQKLLPHHPYYHDLLEFRLGAEFKTKSPPQEPAPLEKTPFEIIHDERKLRHLVRSLRKEKLLAIEYKFSDAKYQKQMQLMQISTPTHDYLIDFAKNQQLIILLTDVFVNPNIQKIFFDAKMAVRQLQHAWKLFFVNIFCVKTVAKAIGSEAYQQSMYALLNKYGSYFKTTHSEACQRPLKNEVKLNLRKETHYLLDIYRKVRDEAVEAGRLDEVAQLCNAICRYLTLDVKYGPHGVFNDYDKFNAAQRHACDQLFEWRDGLALQRDLNPNLVLHKKFFRTIVLALPTKRDELLGVANTPLVKLYALKILNILKEARKKYQKDADPSKYQLSELPPAKPKKKPVNPMKRKNDDFGGSSPIPKRKYYPKKPIKKFVPGKKPLIPPRYQGKGKPGSKPGPWFSGPPKFPINPRNVWDSGQMNQNNYNSYGSGFKYF